MPRLAFFLVFFATSAMAGNLFEPLSSERGGMARGITGARVAVNADALLSSEPFVTLDDASYPLRGIAVEWRAGADFKAEFAIGSASLVSVLTKHEAYFAGVFYPPHGLAYELIPDAGGHTLRRAGVAPFRCEVRSAGFAGAAAESAAALPLARRRAVGHPAQNVVDLAEFWTPRAEIIVGGRGPIETIILNAVDILNADTRQSGISNLTFRLVHEGVVDIEESGGLAEDFFNLTINQNVAQVRANVGADLAGLWSDSVAAAANAPQWRSAFNVRNSFHLMSIRYGPASHTYSHEVFHNFGGQHNEEALYDYLTTPGVDEYPFARDKCTENWITILAYPSCVPVGRQIPTIPYITNPDLEYEGVSLGERDRMDNARMVRLSSPWVAEYYPSVEP
jgi:hypothetical protein